MKKVLFASFLLFSLLTFTGCPVGLDYPPSEPGSDKIDQALLGTWECSGEECSIKKISISKGDKNAYKVEVLERGEMYALETDNMEGWVTEVEGTKIFYTRPDGEDKYYLQAYDVSGGEITTWDISLKVGGVDAVTSTNALRDEIKASKSYDDFLSAKCTWTQ